MFRVIIDDMDIDLTLLKKTEARRPRRLYREQKTLIPFKLMRKAINIIIRFMKFSDSYKKLFDGVYCGIVLPESQKMYKYYCKVTILDKPIELVLKGNKMVKKYDVSITPLIKVYRNIESGIKI